MSMIPLHQSDSSAILHERLQQQAAASTHSHGVFQDLARRTSLFRSMLIEEFRLLESGDFSGGNPYTSRDLASGSILHS